MGEEPVRRVISFWSLQSCDSCLPHGLLAMVGSLAIWRYITWIRTEIRWWSSKEHHGRKPCRSHRHIASAVHIEPKRWTVEASPCSTLVWMPIIVRFVFRNRSGYPCPQLQATGTTELHAWLSVMAVWAQSSWRNRLPEHRIAAVLYSATCVAIEAMNDSARTGLVAKSH